MKIITKKVDLKTNKQIEFIDITENVSEIVSQSDIKDGRVLVFSPHTTASVAINHNEPMLIQDIIRVLFRLAPIDERYNHDLFELTKKNKSDGRSNGHSHCKNVILGPSKEVIVEKGKLLLGEKQSIFFVELDGGRKRDYLVQIIGN